MAKTCGEGKKFFIGAAILAAGGLLSRLIGGLYRIPLMGILGAEGMGVYQLIFPLYSLLLTVSSSAIPVVISRTVAESRALGKGCGGLTKKCLLVFGSAGLVLSIIPLAFSRGIAALQGNAAAAPAYVAIAPSVFLLALVSVLRGVFQGRKNMFPTALSQVAEQLVKVPFGLIAAAKLMPDVEKAVAGAALAVTVSEVFALLLLAVCYLFSKGRKQAAGTFSIGSVLRQSFSVTAGAVAMPVSQIIDSILVINLISAYSDGASAMYGILSGGVFSLINLPVAVAAAVAAAAVPRIAESSAKGERSFSKTPLAATLFVALPCALVFLLMPSSIVTILYPNLSGEESLLMQRLLSAAAVAVPILSVNHILAAHLQATGRSGVPAAAIGTGAAVKILLAFFLLRIPSVNIFGAVISANACYLVATIINLVYIIVNEKKRIGLFGCAVAPCVFAMVFAAALYIVCTALSPLTGGGAAFVIGGAIAAILYAAMIGVLILRLRKKGRKREEL